ncbi:hypothetical protein HZS_3496 [Henneguya salminicola]|nr:hypothetical protein HZS_3496 [Henneguya salminicola]
MNSPQKKKFPKLILFEKTKSQKFNLMKAGILKMMNKTAESYESFYKLDEIICKLNLKNARQTSLYDFFLVKKN